MRKLLSTKEAAHYLGISRFTLDRWKSQRKIAFLRIGRRTLFDVSDLEEFIKQARVEVRDVWANPPEEERPTISL